MNLSEVKQNLNGLVSYNESLYILSGITLRKDKKSNKFFYQAELLDYKNKNSIITCDLFQVQKK